MQSKLYAVFTALAIGACAGAPARHEGYRLPAPYNFAYPDPIVDR